MKYKICVAIPIKSGDINIIKKILENTLDNKPDLIEFRFDYIEEIKLLTDSYLKGILNCIPPNIPKIDFEKNSNVIIKITKPIITMKK